MCRFTKIQCLTCNRVKFEIFSWHFLVLNPPGRRGGGNSGSTSGFQTSRPYTGWRYLFKELFLVLLQLELEKQGMALLKGPTNACHLSKSSVQPDDSYKDVIPVAAQHAGYQLKMQGVLLGRWDQPLAEASTWWVKGYRSTPVYCWWVWNMVLWLEGTLCGTALSWSRLRNCFRGTGKYHSMALRENTDRQGGKAVWACGPDSAPRKCCSLACPAASVKGRHLLLEKGGWKPVTKAGEGSHHWSHVKTIRKKWDPGVLPLCKPLKTMVIMDPKIIKSLSLWTLTNNSYTTGTWGQHCSQHVTGMDSCTSYYMSMN